MQNHIHIKTHSHHATAWVDHDGKVHHDGSILATNAVEEMRKHALHREGKVLEGQPLLDAVVERYDRATMAHAYHCHEHHEDRSHR